MSAPKASTIVLILVVVALVVLFLVGIGLGASGSGSGPTTESRQSLRDRIFKPQSLAPSELVVTGCRLVGKTVQLVQFIPPSSTCIIEIAASSHWMRGVSVRTSDPMRIWFKPKGDPKVPIKVETKSGETNKVDLSVDKEGARLDLTCLRGQPACAATLE